MNKIKYKSRFVDTRGNHMVFFLIGGLVQKSIYYGITRKARAKKTSFVYNVFLCVYLSMGRIIIVPIYHSFFIYFLCYIYGNDNKNRNKTEKSIKYGSLMASDPM